MSAIDYVRLGAEVLGFWFAGSLLLVALWLCLRWLIYPLRIWDQEVRREPQPLDLTGRRW